MIAHDKVYFPDKLKKPKTLQPSYDSKHMIRLSQYKKKGLNCKMNKPLYWDYKHHVFAT